MFFEQPVDFLDLFVFELEGEPRFNITIEFVLTEPHRGLVDAVGGGEPISNCEYLSTRWITWIKIELPYEPRKPGELGVIAAADILDVELLQKLQANIPGPGLVANFTDSLDTPLVIFEVEVLVFVIMIIAVFALLIITHCLPDYY